MKTIRRSPGDKVEEMRDARPLRGVRVLVVDDNVDVLDATSLLLAGYGATVDCAASADEALVRLDSAKPDVLLSDLSMPGRDGFALIKDVRTRDRDLPCVALTALDGGEDRRNAAQAGFDGYATKPLDAGQLVTLLLSTLRR